MSGLFASLNNSIKALNAQSTAIATAGRNLANVNNPNYARQRVLFGDRGTVETEIGPQSLGLEALGITQLRDSLLDQQVVREVGLKSSLTAQQAALQKAQAALGENIDSTTNASSISDTSNNSLGLSSAITDFFNAFQTLASSPTDVGVRQGLLQKASILTDRFNLTDQRLAQVQSDLNTQISGGVDDVNRLLTTIADLNSQIGRLEINAAGSAVDLRDQRQARIEDLAALLPVSVKANAGDNGQVQIVGKDGSGNDVVLVDKATVPGPVTFNGTTLSGGSPATALALSGGSIKGQLDARDGAVQTIRDNLDALAKQLVTSVNTAYNPAGNTGNFFASGGITAGTLQVAGSVTAANLKASDGGAAGDNTVAQAVASLASQTFSTVASTPDNIDGTFTQYYAGTVSDFGQALASTNSRVQDQTNVEQIVRSQRDNVSGVSLDEEMADLLKYQRAYQASSRVFSVVDELLQTVVNNLGAR